MFYHNIYTNILKIHHETKHCCVKFKNHECSENHYHIQNFMLEKN